MLITAIVFFALGNIIRTLRWKFLVDPYTSTSTSRLISSVASGYVFNALAPIKIGDLLRCITATNRKSRNFLILLAGVLIERLFDIVVIWILVIPAIFLINPNDRLRSELVTYLIILTFLAGVIYSLILGNFFIKSMIYKSTMYFAQDSKLLILRFFYYLQKIAKDIFKSTEKRKFVIYTAGMWIMYTIAYFFFSLEKNDQPGIGRVLKYFIDQSNPIQTQNTSILSTQNLIVNIFPSLILLAVSSFVYLLKKNHLNMESNKLWFVNPEDELRFYHNYFNSRLSDWQHGYFTKKNTRILKDYSGLSGATTLLIENDQAEKTYKKHAVGPYAETLEQQFKFLANHQDNEIFIDAFNPIKGKTYFAYEMNAMDGFVPLDVVMQRLNEEKTEKIYFQLQEVLQAKIYSKGFNLKSTAHQMFLQQKYYQNIDRLLEYLNNKGVNSNWKLNNYTLDNLWNLKFPNEKLHSLLDQDTPSHSHGDLTLENILYNEYKQQFLLIDPAPNELIQSKIIDLAKLSISISNSFELIRFSKVVQLNDSEFWYPPLTTKELLKLKQVHQNYLENIFSNSQLQLLYFYKIVHWLRIINRRIQENDSSVLAYVAQLNLDLTHFKDLLEG